jgi:transcriptional regulator with PAS, ATPase and Fis domain
MKQQKQLVDFFNQQAEWFAQFNNVDTLDRVLDLCESAGLYFVDKNQRVFYWSQRLEQLSGLPSEKVVGKQALPEY